MEWEGRHREVSPYPDLCHETNHRIANPSAGTDCRRRDLDSNLRSPDCGTLLSAPSCPVGCERNGIVRSRCYEGNRHQPNTGRRLRGLFQEVGFSRVEASAHYICYGTPDRIIAFAYDRAAECRNQRLQATVARHGIARVEELTPLAASWEEWGRDPGAFFAFPWCRILAWA